MEIFGILVSLIGLMGLAYLGYSVIFFAPLCAAIAVVLSSKLPLMPAYTEIFMSKMGEYVKAYFPVFMLGAVFGKIMEETGMAKAIASAIIKYLGKERAILSVVLSCAFLTYGGVSLFVVVFAVYPLAAILFREAGIPKRLIPPSIALGAFTFTMDALPGTPQIQNIIPTQFFNTTAYAAPICGICGAILIFTLGMTWITRQKNNAEIKNEGYEGTEALLNEPKVSENEKTLPFWAAVLPLLSVLIVNLYLSNPFHFSWCFNWNSAMLEPFKEMKIALMTGHVEKAQPIWSLIIALFVGIGLASLIGVSRLPKGGFAKAISAGTVGSLLAVINTASEYGYGSVVSSVEGFQKIKDVLVSLQHTVGLLVSEAISVTTLSGVTGSASGGMTIVLGMLGNTYLEMAKAANIPPEMLHRVACMAAGGMDTLPHNGAVITLLAVCGLTHKQSYPDIFVITIIKTLTVFFIIGLHSATGLS
ncbi:MAG: GntP family permease [Candidatus Riflebacteria bacterium]|nr:GntP family permease [Candidatus Riflebacteria bacterium]